MYALYSFGVIPNFMSNSPNTTSSIGEISQYGATFSTEIGTYTRPKYPDVGLLSIDSRRDEIKVEVGLDYYDVLLQITQWLYTRTVAALIPTDPVALKQELNAEFATVASITDVGRIITYKHYLFPERLTITLSGTGEENLIYLWYANDTYIQEYPLTEIKVLLPVTPIDLLMGSRESCLALLSKINEETHNAQLQILIGQQPQSYIWTKRYNWTDKNNDDIVYPAPFSAAIYGPAGINVDLIEEALRNEILKNSEFTKDEWALVFPELFIPTEFYLVPTWDRYSLPNQVLTTGAYSPTVPIPLQMPYAEKYFKGYPKEFIAENTCVSGSLFKSTAFLSCGNPQNYKVPTRFDLLWPEYCLIDSLSPEFGKIDPDTREFIYAMTTLFKAAEEATEKSLIPSGLTRVVRDGVYYLTISVGKVQYFCPIKKNFSLP